MDKKLKESLVKDLLDKQRTLHVGNNGHVITPKKYHYSCEDQRSLIALHWLRNMQTHRFLLRATINKPDVYINTRTGERKLMPTPVPEGWNHYVSFGHVTGLFIERPAFSNDGGDSIVSEPLLTQVHQSIGFVEVTATNFVRFYLAPYRTVFENEMDKKN